MASKTRPKQKAAKRQTSTQSVEAGVKAAQDVFAKILNKADPEPSVSKVRKLHQ